ncbi:hypothetical protein HZS_3266 [Henneguya salminicola]|nr:hypothetical protein HZS_3266 [Henneguya salminicola]
MEIKCSVNKNCTISSKTIFENCVQILLINISIFWAISRSGNIQLESRLSAYNSASFYCFFTDTCGAIKK